MFKNGSSKDSVNFNKQQGSNGVKLLLALAFITFLALPATAIAEDSNNKMYFGFNLGMSMPSDSDTTFSNAFGYEGADANTTMEADSGLATGIVIGRSFNNFRLEGELAYQKNDITSVTLDSVSYMGYTENIGYKTSDVDGDISSTALLVNGYYDFKNNSNVTPFIGAGLGLAKLDASALRIENIYYDSDSDIVPAAQLSLGANVEITEVVSLDFKYRYFFTADPDFDLASSEYSTNNFYTGMRFSF